MGFVVTIAKWTINIILIMMLVWLFVWIAKFVFFIFWDKKRMDAIGKKVNGEMVVEMKLPIEEAWKSAEAVLRERAQCEEWGGPPPQEITNIIGKLDPSVRDLFVRYKKIWFSDNGTLISADCLLEDTHSVGEYMVGKNDWMHDILLIHSDGPHIYEVYDATIREIYPSLIHYIAFIENEQYWD